MCRSPSRGRPNWNSRASGVGSSKTGGAVSVMAAPDQLDELRLDEDDLAEAGVPPHGRCPGRIVEVVRGEERGGDAVRADRLAFEQGIGRVDRLLDPLDAVLGQPQLLLVQVRPILARGDGRREVRAAVKRLGGHPLGLLLRQPGIRPELGLESGLRLGPGVDQVHAGSRIERMVDEAGSSRSSTQCVQCGESGARMPSADSRAQFDTHAAMGNDLDHSHGVLKVPYSASGYPETPCGRT